MRGYNERSNRWEAQVRVFQGIMEDLERVPLALGIGPVWVENIQSVEAGEFGECARESAEGGRRGVEVEVHAQLPGVIQRMM